MTALCERMVKDRTDQLREEYDKVLANKLAEQYEAFLKFNHDQIQTHFSRSSDASCKYCPVPLPPPPPSPLLPQCWVI